MLGSFTVVSALCVLLFLVQSCAFFQPSAMARVSRKSDLNMMFGIGGKKEEEIIIKVDGKTIKCGTGVVNLRQELQSKGFDVYPLKAKIQGSCNGNGTIPIFLYLVCYVICICMRGCKHDF